MKLISYKKLKKIAAVTSFCLLCGCQAGFESTDVSLVSAKPFGSNVYLNELKTDFYTLFEDRYLNYYVNEALLHNNTLKKALLSLQNSRLNLSLVKDDSSYHVSSDIALSKSRELSNHDSFSSGSRSSIGLSYVVDLWSKNSYKEASAENLLRADSFSYLNVRLGIIESVVSAYLQRLLALEALDLAKDDVKDSKARLDIVAGKYKAGAIDRLEYDRALLDYEDTRQSLYQSEHNLKQCSNALNALLGRAYDSPLQSGSLDKIKEPEFMLKLPLSLLQSRPDLLSAFYKIHMGLYDLEVAKREYFPDLNVSLSINAGDTMSLGRIISNPVLALGSVITLPFLDYKKLSIKEQMQKNTLESYKVEYVDLYINALKECSDAINAQSYYKDSLIRAKNSYDLAKSNYDRTLFKYRHGDMALSDLLDSAVILRQKALMQKQMQFNLLNSQLMVMIALGGGVDKNALDAIYKDLDDK